MRFPVISHRDITHASLRVTPLPIALVSFLLFIYFFINLINANEPSHENNPQSIQRCRCLQKPPI